MSGARSGGIGGRLGPGLPRPEAPNRPPPRPPQALPPDVTLRPAAATDIPALSRLETVAFGRDAWTERIIREELAGPDRHYVVAQGPGQRVVGYAGAFLGDVADIMTVGVEPSARGRGIGRALVENLLAAAGRARRSEVFLEVRVDNEPAIGLYQSLGFEPIGVRPRYYQPEGVDALVMRLALERGPGPVGTPRRWAPPGET
ncbi:MAG: ribosomal protein S18-alanine N-acetyltransferase [Bifidobacteriaceae bacterium]|nr:ribosomal protein S18-alanine N-acetyltransferase [Bifidobacteriaceae bacterium]